MKKAMSKVVRARHKKSRGHSEIVGKHPYDLTLLDKHAIELAKTTGANGCRQVLLAHDGEVWAVDIERIDGKIWYLSEHHFSVAAVKKGRVVAWMKSVQAS